MRDEATLKTLGPQYWEGKRFRPAAFSATGRDGQFVAIRTDIREPDDISANPYQTAYWSYANLVFTNAFPAVPGLRGAEPTLGRYAFRMSSQPLRYTGRLIKGADSRAFVARRFL